MQLVQVAAFPAAVFLPLACAFASPLLALLACGCGEQRAGIPGHSTADGAAGRKSQSPVLKWWQRSINAIFMLLTVISPTS